jgi:hypothetical protein
MLETKYLEISYNKNKLFIVSNGALAAVFISFGMITS